MLSLMSSSNSSHVVGAVLGVHGTSPQCLLLSAVWLLVILVSVVEGAADKLVAFANSGAVRFVDGRRWSLHSLKTLAKTAELAARVWLVRTWDLGVS